MAEAAIDHSDSKHTVDELFQFLVCVRDLRPAIARKEIMDYLQSDKLQIDYHIRGGARKTRPMRQATLEELREQETTGATLDHLYETAPPEGITRRVHFQSWGKLFDLTVRDECLIVEPNCALDYPWDAYSFTVANWSLVEELWPNPNRARSDLSAPASKPEDPPAPSATAVAIGGSLGVTQAVQTLAAAGSVTASKVERDEWLNKYLTEERQVDLSMRHNKITSAAIDLHALMLKDPTVQAYAHARNIERHPTVRKLFPPSRPSKKKKS